MDVVKALRVADEFAAAGATQDRRHVEMKRFGDRRRNKKEEGIMPYVREVYERPEMFEDIVFRYVTCAEHRYAPARAVAVFTLWARSAELDARWAAEVVRRAYAEALSV